MSVLPAAGRAAECAELQINLKAIADNYQIIKKRYKGRTCGAVVKADAYGLGAQTIVPVLKSRVAVFSLSRRQTKQPTCSRFCVAVVALLF